MKKDKEKKEKKKKNKKESFSQGNNNLDKGEELFFSRRRTIRELIAPNGVNPAPLEYMVVEDNGQPLYTLCLYIHKLPRTSHFAETYATLFNFVGVTSSVFIEPMMEGKSSSQLDKRIVVLDSECIAAEKDGNRNRYRKVSNKLLNTEKYAVAVESGDNQLYEVSFLFTLQAETLDKLRIMASDFHMLGREKGIELCSCYSVHPEAFLSGYPTNKIYKAKRGIASSSVVKKHVLDKMALCDIFNHTRGGFSHKNGIYAGYNMLTGQPIMYDVYDKSHEGYGVAVFGKTGTGKSATIKIFLSRYVDFGYKIRSLDFEPRGSRGEYSLMTEAVGGVNYQVKRNADVILNPFDANEEEVFDEITGKEYQIFDLASTKVDLFNIVMLMVVGGKEVKLFSETTFMERIIKDAITDVYEERGFVDGDIESLYMISQTFINGQLGSGKVRKPRPTITDLFKRLIINRKNNKIDYYDEPYQLVIDTVRDYVKEVYYCPDCFHFFDREEFLAIKQDGVRCCPHCGKNIPIVEVHGERSYFDGQSTVEVSPDLTHINIDISQLTKEEREVAMLIGMQFLQQHCVKRNSSNPKKAQKMIFMVDELHKLFKYEKARSFITDAYRTYRKRNVSPWTATQGLSDYKGYSDMEALLKNTSTMLLLKQALQDRDYIKETTPLTDSQIDMVFNLGGDPDEKDESVRDRRKGEVCLIDNQSKVAFLKVDYLTGSEAKIVETDMRKIQEMYTKKAGVN